MPKTRVTITGLGRDFERIQAQTIQRLADKQIQAIAEETALVIKQKITERIKRSGSEGNLANAFFAFPITNGWAVGDIEYLDTHAPYWYFQNYGVTKSGRKRPPISKGQFSPGIPQPTKGQSGSRWYSSTTGGFLIVPQKDIQAKNYIQATINEINQIIARVIQRIK